MAIQEIEIWLRAWYPHGHSTSPEEFAMLTEFKELLEIDESDPITALVSPPIIEDQIASIRFLQANYQTYKNRPELAEPTETFAQELYNAFEQIAEWLDRRPFKAINALQQAGAKTDIFIGLWIDNDQLDLRIPPSFLRSCGKHNLCIEIISND